MTRRQPSSSAERDALKQRIAQLERELAELHASLPAHSIKATMLMRLEELEEELLELRANLESGETREHI